MVFNFLWAFLLFPPPGHRQCLCLYKQLSALLPHVTAFAWAGSAQDLQYLIQTRQSSRPLEVSGAVRGSQSSFCYAMPKGGPEEAAPEQGGKGRSLLGWREQCKHREGAQASIPTDTLEIQTHPHWQSIVLYFPQCCLGKHSLVFSGAPGGLTEKDWLLPCPEWEVTPTIVTGRDSPLVLAQEWHLLLLG